MKTQRAFLGLAFLAVVAVAFSGCTQSAEPPVAEAAVAPGPVEKAPEKTVTVKPKKKTKARASVEKKRPPTPEEFEVVEAAQ